MADDWVKMRTDLYRDPKVCIIADKLMDSESQLSRFVRAHNGRDMSVTRNVTRGATVGALVALWGVTRHRGERDGDDLLIPSATLSVCDDITEIPGFGEAMQSVGWVAETRKGLVFPRFFESYNVDPEADARAKKAERQRRYRAKRGATRGATVAPQSGAREEKEKEEENYLTSPPRVSSGEVIGPGDEPRHLEASGDIAAESPEAAENRPRIDAEEENDLSPTQGTERRRIDPRADLDKVRETAIGAFERAARTRLTLGHISQLDRAVAALPEVIHIDGQDRPAWEVVGRALSETAERASPSTPRAAVNYAMQIIERCIRDACWPGEIPQEKKDESATRNSAASGRGQREAPAERRARERAREYPQEIQLKVERF